MTPEISSNLSHEQRAERWCLFLCEWHLWLTNILLCLSAPTFNKLKTWQRQILSRILERSNKFCQCSASGPLATKEWTTVSWTNTRTKGKRMNKRKNDWACKNEVRNERLCERNEVTNERMNEQASENGASERTNERTKGNRKLSEGETKEHSGQ